MRFTRLTLHFIDEETETQKREMKRRKEKKRKIEQPIKFEFQINNNILVEI